MKNKKKGMLILKKEKMERCEERKEWKKQRY